MLIPLVLGTTLIVVAFTMATYLESRAAPQVDRDWLIDVAPDPPVLTWICRYCGESHATFEGVAFHLICEHPEILEEVDG